VALHHQVEALLLQHAGRAPNWKSLSNARIAVIEDDLGVAGLPLDNSQIVKLFIQYALLIWS
jgi:hypothetical protein